MIQKSEKLRYRKTLLHKQFVKQYRWLTKRNTLKCVSSEYEDIIIWRHKIPYSYTLPPAIDGGIYWNKINVLHTLIHTIDGMIRWDINRFAVPARPYILDIVRGTAKKYITAVH